MQNIDGQQVPLSGESVAESQVKAYLLGIDGHGNIPNDVNIEDCTYNQNHVSIIQSGANAVIYALEELRTFDSTDENQGLGEWIGIDIDTGTDDITELSWNGYPLTENDVEEAAGIGLGAGHIIFWAKAADLASSAKHIVLAEGLEITIGLIRELPANAEYTFNEDKTEMQISGLSDANLDKIYCVNVTAERNNVETTKTSGNYRVTNAPAKPVLMRRVLDSNQQLKQIVSDYSTETQAVPISRFNRSGQYNSIAFSVQPIAQGFSDSLQYIWMRMNVDEGVDSDWITDDIVKLQVDIGENLADLFSDITGADDIPVLSEGFELKPLTGLGEEVVDSADNGPTLHLSDATNVGYYYCIVVNTLNNHRVANVTPFFHVQ